MCFVPLGCELLFSVKEQLSRLEPDSAPVGESGSESEKGLWDSEHALGNMSERVGIREKCELLFSVKEQLSRLEPDSAPVGESGSESDKGLWDSEHAFQKVQ